MKSLFALVTIVAVATVASAGEKKSLRVVIIAGSTEYAPEKTMPILKKHLESKLGCNCTLLIAKLDKTPPKSPGKDVLAGTEALDKCDVLILCSRRIRLQGDQLERVKKYCTSGKPLVGIRTASHGIQTWLELDKEVLGGNYNNHYPEGPLCQVRLPDDDKKRSILKGVTEFKSKGSLYKNTGLSKDVDVLLYGSIPDHTEPIAWTRNYKGGRIFYTSLGHQNDFEEESFLRLIGNAVLWTTQRN